MPRYEERSGLLLPWLQKRHSGTKSYRAVKNVTDTAEKSMKGWSTVVQQPVIIIDEYDTPIQQGHSEDYYDKIIRFMRNLFSGGFKDNGDLSTDQKQSFDYL